MKSIIVLSIIFLAGSLSNALGAAAPCDNSGRLNPGQITNAVQGKLVCAQSTTNSDRWSEEHLAGGQLWEYAKGPGDKVDPRRLAGTWSIVGTGNNAVIRYNYGTGGTYDRALWTSDNVNYSFCNAGAVVATAPA